MLCFHSTGSIHSLNAILKGDMSRKSETVWDVSDNDGCFYVYPKDKLIDSYGYEEDDKDSMINLVFENGIIQTVCNDGDKAYVIELDIPDELLQDDYSCSNMSDIASFIECDDFDTSMIKTVYQKEVSIYFKPFIVMSLIDNKNFTDMYIDDNLLLVADSLADGRSEICIFEKLCETPFYEIDF